MEPDSQLSPALLRKVVHAGTCSTSFRQAADDLWVLADVQVSAQRIRRACERIGDERVAESWAAAEAYQRLTLPAQQQSPTGQAPPVACVETDGGRIQIRPRMVREASPSADQGEAWWRETKVGCLLSMTSQVHAHDPTPNIPTAFVDPRRMLKISREIKGVSHDAAEPDAAADAWPEVVHASPKIVSQSVVATRENVERFGKRLVAAAHQLGFAAASRKAFVADGSETNWGLWRRHFSHYTPILDWVHAVCYVYAAAMTGVSASVGWATYRDWAQWLWGGRIDLILEQLTQRQSLLGLPTENDAETSPSRRVADALRYLSNQRTRMNYPEYRRQGLPITSSHVESTIKRVNRRMKGTEKFWDQGAEPLLQLVADHLGPTAVTKAFWAGRPTKLSSQRCYCQ